MSSLDFVRAMQEGLSRLLRCGICQERFRSPRVLPCHHTFCSDCLEAQASSGEIVCPECIASHRLPSPGIRSFAGDTRVASLLELQGRWRLGCLESCTGAETEELGSLRAELHQLRASVEDFNRCADLWDRVQQSAEEDLVGTGNNGKQVEGALRLLRKRRRLLHQKLDEFLREETASVQSRVQCEFSRASEYCAFVEGRLRNFEAPPAIADLNHMRGQCAAISRQTGALLSTICEQTAKMPLKIVRATDRDDVQSPVPCGAFYGVDVGVQVSADVRDRARRLPPVGYVPPLRSRRNSSESDTTVCSSRKSPLDPYGGRAVFARGGSDGAAPTKPRGYGDVHKMRVFGRSWFQGGKRRSTQGPAGVAVVRDGLLAVTDTANGCLRLCTPSGLSPRRVLAHDGVLTNFGDPQAVCVDRPRRHLYVTDRDGACVVTLDIDSGEDVNTITCAGHRPIGVALDSDSETLYICCEETHAVVMYRTDGTLVGQIGERGREPGQFLYPNSLAISPDNRLWVTDTNNNRMQVFTLAGKFVKAVGARGSGLGQLNHPRGLTIDDRGFVLVADTGNQRVQVFDSTGKSLLVFGREGGPSTTKATGSSGSGGGGGGGGPAKVSRHQGVAGPVGVASTGSRGVTRGKVFVSYQGDPRIVAYLVQYQR